MPKNTKRMKTFLFILRNMEQLRRKEYGYIWLSMNTRGLSPKVGGEQYRPRGLEHSVFPHNI